MKPIIIILSVFILSGCFTTPKPIIKEPEYIKLFVKVKNINQTEPSVGLKVIIEKDTNYYSFGGDDFNWIGVEKGDTIIIKAYPTDDDTKYDFNFDSTYIVITDTASPDSIYLDISPKRIMFTDYFSPHLYYSAKNTDFLREDTLVLKQLASTLTKYPNFIIEFDFYMDCKTAQTDSAEIMSKQLESNVKGVLAYYGIPTEQHKFVHFYEKHPHNQCDCIQTKIECSDYDYAYNRTITWKVVGYR